MKYTKTGNTDLEKCKILKGPKVEIPEFAELADAGICSKGQDPRRDDCKNPNNFGFDFNERFIVVSNSDLDGGLG